MGKKFKGTTHILFVLDESGSMYFTQHDTIGGYNQYINQIKEDLKDQDIRFSLVKFADKFKSVHENILLSEVPELNEKTYSPYGSTALLDAVGHVVTDIAKVLKKKDRALVVILTDGEENSSKEYSSDSLRKLIEDKEKEGNWTFTYQGANQDSWQSAQSIGLSSIGNTVNYDALQPKEAFARMATATRSYASGQCFMVNDFYETENK